MNRIDGGLGYRGYNFWPILAICFKFTKIKLAKFINFYVDVVDKNVVLDMYSFFKVCEHDKKG